MKDEDKNGVYLITNLITKQIYVGSTSNIGGFKKRWRENYNTYLTNSFVKYGKENFKFEILEICEPQYCLAYEQVYLDYFKPWFETGNGYNFCKIAGSSLGVKHSEEAKKNMSEAARNKPKVKQETKEKIKKAISGLKRSDTSIRKMIAAKQNISKETKDKMSLSQIGKHHSKEAIKKMSLAKQNMSINTKTKMSISHKIKIERIDMNTGEVKEYESIKETSLDGFNITCVWACCSGNRNANSHKGFFWKYFKKEKKREQEINDTKFNSPGQTLPS